MNTERVEVPHKFSYSDDSEEVMYVAPSGHTRFLGIWEAFTLAYELVNKRKRKVTLNGEAIN
jgi:hypothetical protein